jgi:hypothetical protein
VTCITLNRSRQSHVCGEADQAVLALQAEDAAIARAAADKDVATILSNMANEYLAEAARLHSDKPLDIGEPPRRS